MSLPVWIWNVVLVLVVTVSFLVATYGLTHFFDACRADCPKVATVFGWMAVAIVGIGLTVTSLFAISLN